MSIVQLTSSQRRKLRTQLRRTPDASHYRRLLAVLELDRGKSVAEVADLLRVTRQSVYNWVSSFAACPTPAGLEDRYGVGRPSAWTSELQALLLTSLQQRPDAWGYAAVNWTVALLQEHLYCHGGCWLSDDTIRRELDRLDYVWKRFRYVLPPDPEREKKRAIRRRLRALPARSAKLAEDETDLRLFPPLRAGWARRGEEAPVPISGGNAKRVLFGAINIETGYRLFLPHRRQRGVEFEDFLEEVRWYYRGRHVALLLDEDSSHTAEDSQNTADDLGIELLWLPKRCPHLNPMDYLWRHGKEVMSANHQYASIEVQVERFIRYLAGLSPYEALKKAGIFSKDFWLKP